MVGAAAITLGVFAEDQGRQLGRPLPRRLLARWSRVRRGRRGRVCTAADQSVVVAVDCGRRELDSQHPGWISERGPQTARLQHRRLAYLFLAWLLLAFPTGLVRGRRGRNLLAAMGALLVVRTLARLFLYVPRMAPVVDA